MQLIPSDCLSSRFFVNDDWEAFWFYTNMCFFTGIHQWDWRQCFQGMLMKTAKERRHTGVHPVHCPWGHSLSPPANGAGIEPCQSTRHLPRPAAIDHSLFATSEKEEDRVTTVLNHALCKGEIMTSAWL